MKKIIFVIIFAVTFGKIDALFANSQQWTEEYGDGRNWELIAWFDFSAPPRENNAIVMPIETAFQVLRGGAAPRFMTSAGQGLTTMAETFGTFQVLPGAAPGGANALQMSDANQFWMHLTQGDGSPLLAGVSEFAISYYVKATEPNDGDNGWLFWVGRSTAPPRLHYERYIAVREFTDLTAVRRWFNAGDPQIQGSNITTPRSVEQRVSASNRSGWRKVTVVFAETSTRVYYDGELVWNNRFHHQECVRSIISAAGGYALVGKNQVTRGHLTSTTGNLHTQARPDRFFNGQIANFRVYVPAAPETDRARVAAAREALTLRYNTTTNPVFGNIHLPETGLYGTSIRWTTNRPDIVDVNRHEVTFVDNPPQLANDPHAPRLPGMVTRPAYADAVVQLTAHISYEGRATQTRHFVFTVAQAPPPLVHDDKEAYLLVHFVGEGSPDEEQIYFAISLDMKTFTDLNPRGAPALRNTLGDFGARDPFIIRSPEGDRFFMVATDLSIHLRNGWGNHPDGTGTSFASTNLVVWETFDLVNWSEPRLIDVAGNVLGARMAWAPNVVYDYATGEFFVFWATATTSYPTTLVAGLPVFNTTSARGDSEAFPRPTYWHMYYTRTRDFRNFSPARVWIDAFGNRNLPNTETGDGSIYDTAAILVGEGLDARWFRTSKECWGGTNTGNRSTFDVSMDHVMVGGNIYAALTGRWDRSAPIDGSNDTLHGQTATRTSVQGIFYPYLQSQNPPQTFSGSAAAGGRFGAIEGPEFILYNRRDWIDDRPTWGLIVDAYGNGIGYVPFLTHDLNSMTTVDFGGSWSESAADLGPLRKRHGGIIAITRAEYDALMNHFKGPKADFPSYFSDELTAGMQLIAHFDFDNIANPTQAASFVDLTGNAMATPRSGDTGRPVAPKSLTPNGNGYAWLFPQTSSAAARRWLDIRSADDTPLLLDANGNVYETIVVSFDSKRTNPHATGGNGDNVFHLCRDGITRNEANRHLMNYFTTRSSVRTFGIERSMGGRQTGPSGVTNPVGEWNRFDIVITPVSTALYINGQLADARYSEHSLADILGEYGGVVHFGRGNAATNGEFYIGLIDNLKIFATSATQ